MFKNMSKTKLLGYILTAIGGLVSLAASAVMMKAGEEDTRSAVNDYIAEHRNEFVLEAKN